MPVRSDPYKLGPVNNRDPEPLGSPQQIRMSKTQLQRANKNRACKIAAHEAIAFNGNVVSRELLGNTGPACTFAASHHRLRKKGTDMHPINRGVADGHFGANLVDTLTDNWNQDFQDWDPANGVPVRTNYSQNPMDVPGCIKWGCAGQLRPIPNHLGQLMANMALNMRQQIRANLQLCGPAPVSEDELHAAVLLAMYQAKCWENDANRPPVPPPIDNQRT